MGWSTAGWKKTVGHPETWTKKSVDPFILEMQCPYRSSRDFANLGFTLNSNNGGKSNDTHFSGIYFSLFLYILAKGHDLNTTTTVWHLSKQKIYIHIIIYNLPSFNISLSSLIQMKKTGRHPQFAPARGFRCAWASVVIWVPISDPFFSWKKGTKPWNTRACKRNDMWNLICGNFNMTYEYIYIYYIYMIWMTAHQNRNGSTVRSVHFCRTTESASSGLVLWFWGPDILGFEDQPKVQTYSLQDGAPFR